MSSLQTTLAKFQRKFDPLHAAIGKAIPGSSQDQLAKQEEMDAQANTKDAAARAAYDEKLGAVNREMSVATREQKRGRAASAAGATRSDNDADLLGYVAGGAKRKSASRTILG